MIREVEGPEERMRGEELVTVNRKEEGRSREN